MNLYKPYLLQSVYINSFFINEGSNKFYCCNYRNNSNLLYEVYENIIHYNEYADINIVQKIDLIHKPFIVI